MIPHKTVAITWKDFFRNKEKSIISKYIPTKNYIWVGGGRCAIENAISQGSVVGVPAFTCTVVKESIERAGATIKWIDAGIIVTSDAIEAVADEIDTLFLPYNFGFMPDMDAIVEICKKNRIKFDNN